MKCSQEPLWNWWSRKLLKTRNKTLCAEFFDEEISNALFQNGTLKAPGKDGFPARFCQRDWGVFKDDIIAAIKEFLIVVECQTG